MDIVTYGLIRNKLGEVEEEAKHLPVHVCVSGEYDTTTGQPTIQNPDEKVFYLAPSTDSGSDLFIEWVYVDGAWEQFGVTSVELDDYVTKASLENAGITSKTYEPQFGGEFTVTTAETTGILNPYARTDLSGSLSKEYSYRVTFDGTKYELPTELWFYNTLTSNSATFKLYQYIGNIGLYLNDTSGINTVRSSIPFCILFDRDDAGKIDIITSIAASHTILVEKIVYTKSELPNDLIYGNAFKPFEKRNNSGTFNGLSLGLNKITNTRGSFAIGYANTVSNEFGIAIGYANTVSGRQAFAEGMGNTVSGENGHVEGILNTSSNMGSHAEGVTVTASGYGSHAEGFGTTASANEAHAEGFNTVASGIYSHVEGGYTTASVSAAHAEGLRTVASGYSSHTEGYYTIANGFTMHAQGYFNIADTLYPDWTANTSYAVGDKVNRNGTGKECIEANSDATYTSSKWKTIYKTGPTAFVIGNGISENERSNACVIDWDGNECLTGDLTIFKGTGKEISISSLLTGSVVNVSGATPAITALPNHRYVCEMVDTISFTPSDVGTCEVRFVCGSTPAVLTLPSDVVFPEWFDYTELEADTIYDVMITDGIYGCVMSWHNNADEK